MGGVCRPLTISAAHHDPERPGVGGASGRFQLGSMVFHSTLRWMRCMSYLLYIRHGGVVPCGAGDSVHT